MGTFDVGTVSRWKAEQYQQHYKKVSGSVQIAVWALLACIGNTPFFDYATIKKTRG